MKLPRNLFGIILIISSLCVVVTDAYGQPVPENIIERFHYRSIGPTRQSGRFVDIEVPELQPYTFYAAAGSGGLWKTVNNGITFTPVFDHENSIAIGDIATAPSDPDIVWVGTGEANGDYWGDGMYKSTDGGTTWTNMGLRGSSRIGRIRIHPGNPDIVYVAATGRFNSQNPERGVFKTTDGGETWSKLTAGLPGSGMGRIGLDIYLKNPDILYAVIHVPDSSGGNSQNRIYRTDNAGRSWRRLGQPSGAGLRGGSYFGQIRVDPNDENHVYVLSVNMYETKDAGTTWDIPYRERDEKRLARVDFYDDHHAMWIDPENSDHMLLGNDHGMGITYDAGKNWYHPDELPLAQFYAIAVDMDYPYNVYGGTQDNGNFRGPGTKKGKYPIRLEDWEYWGTGDGSHVQVDPSNTRWVYNESQNGDIERIDQRTGRRKRIMYRENPDIRFNFNTPILISPHNTDVVLQGANVLLRSPNRGESWEEISQDLSNYDENITSAIRRVKNTITTIAESPVTEGVIWAGTDDGNVQLTRDGGKTWKKLNDRIPGYPGYWVSRVAASHHYAGTAYVSFRGRDRDDFRPFVYKTADYGETWVSIAANLPDESVNVIREDHKNPNLLFAGNDKAVYVTIDGGRNWTRMQNNMPTQPVHDLVIHPRENDLVVGTYGRGIFITDISPLQELTPDVLRQDVHFFNIEPKVQWVIPRENVVSSQNFAGENEPYGLIINYYLRNSTDSEVMVRVYRGEQLLRELRGSGSAGLNSVEWRMDTRQERTEEEKERWKIRYIDFLDQPYTKFQQVSYHNNGFDPDSPDHIGTQQPPGEYTVKLSVNGRELTRKAEILKDHWFIKYH